MPVVGEPGAKLLGGRDHHRRLVRNQVEERAEPVDGQDLGDVGAFGRVLARSDLGQLAVLGAELGGGRDLDLFGLAQRALGEGREPAQRLDLVAEQLDPHRPLLGRGVDVEDASAHRELAALEDLLLALVAQLDQALERLLEVDLLADAQREPVWAKLRVGHPLHERHGARHDHGGRVLG